MSTEADNTSEDLETKTERKRGKLSLEDEQFIKDNVNRLPVEEIAERLNRTVDPIKKYIREQKLMKGAGVHHTKSYKEIKEKLYSEKFWDVVKSQLHEQEIPLFVDFWVRYVQQFAADIQPTEETQIRDLVMLDILQHRLFKHQIDGQKEIHRLKEELMQELSKDKADRDMDYLKSCREGISAIETVISSSDNNILNYQNKKDAILKSLHATRQDRVKNIKVLKSDFASLMREFEDEEVKRREGMEMELRRIAAERSRENLGAWHKFQDGTVDRPLLNSETVMRNEDEEDKE